jgi:hypothetical protein
VFPVRYELNCILYCLNVHCIFDEMGYTHSEADAIIIITYFIISYFF